MWVRMRSVCNLGFLVRQPVICIVCCMAYCVYKTTAITTSTMATATAVAAAAAARAPPTTPIHHVRIYTHTHNLISVKHTERKATVFGCDEMSEWMSERVNGRAGEWQRASMLCCYNQPNTCCYIMCNIKRIRTEWKIVNHWVKLNGVRWFLYIDSNRYRLCALDFISFVPDGESASHR